MFKVPNETTSCSSVYTEVRDMKEDVIQQNVMNKGEMIIMPIDTIISNVHLLIVWCENILVDELHIFRKIYLNRPKKYEN